MLKKFTAVTCLLLVGCEQAPPPQTAGPDPYADTKRFVVASLKDPESARFGQFSPGKNGSVCGLVNARNGFGGYSGMSPFVYSPNGPEADRLYIYGAEGDWNDKGIMAEIFADRGCTIGTDHARALEVRKLLADSFKRETQPAL